MSYVNVGRLIDDINADGYSDVVELDGSRGSRQAVFFNGDGVDSTRRKRPNWRSVDRRRSGERFTRDVKAATLSDLVV